MVQSLNGWDWSKSRSQELLPDLHVGAGAPSTWSIFCCFRRCVSRELDHSGAAGTPTIVYGMPAPKVEALPAVPQYWPKPK